MNIGTAETDNGIKVDCVMNEAEATEIAMALMAWEKSLQVAEEVMGFDVPKETKKRVWVLVKMFNDTVKEF